MADDLPAPIPTSPFPIPLGHVVSRNRFSGSHALLVQLLTIFKQEPECQHAVLI
jgi:hypothetical protein